MKKNRFFRVVTSLSVALALTCLMSITPANAFTARDLVYGSQGYDVNELQGRLKTLGYYWGNVDGRFGWDTFWAVRTFQYNFGMNVNGAADMPTKMRLVRATPNWRSQSLAASGNGNSGNSRTTGGGQNGGGGHNGGSGNGNTNGSQSSGASTATIATDAPSVVNGVNRTDINLLAHLVYGEARGETFVGQVAIAAVILNRLRDPRFPHSIPAIVYQPGAFTATSDGQAYLDPNASSMRAVMQAVHGWDPSSGAVYYYNPATATSPWIWSRPIIKKIGHHVFCR